MDIVYKGQTYSQWMEEYIHYLQLFNHQIIKANGYPVMAPLTYYEYIEGAALKPKAPPNTCWNCKAEHYEKPKMDGGGRYSILCPCCGKWEDEEGEDE